MSSDIPAAWAAGFTGRGATITIVDDFRNNPFRASFGLPSAVRTHGEWTSLEARMVAPGARVVAHDYNRDRPVTLGTGLNILNASFGLYVSSNVVDSGAYKSMLPADVRSMAKTAREGRAVVVAAAANASAGVLDSTRIAGLTGDVKNALAYELAGAQSAIFVGALNRNGAPLNKASLASYSNHAGAGSVNGSFVHDQFVVVGVDAAAMGTAGTSFAAPIVSGYAAILGSKFRTATPTQITNQILRTARTDTISGYDRFVHGRGEASLSRALAPVSMPR